MSEKRDFLTYFFKVIQWRQRFDFGEQPCKFRIKSIKQTFEISCVRLLLVLMMSNDNFASDVARNSTSSEALFAMSLLFAIERFISGMRSYALIASALESSIFFSKP